MRASCAGVILAVAVVVLAAMPHHAVAARLRTAGAPSGQPNPPTWPASVRVFDPSDTDIEQTVNAAFAVNGGHEPANNGQFSSARYAFLFKPGTYTADVPVGFYTHVLGLGASPDDVVFTGDKGVYCEEGDYVFSGGALDTFWRIAENFKTTSTHNWATGTGMLWAVSQAAPLRRVHVTADLAIYEYQPPYGAAGYASGGYMGNSKVDGTVYSGSQQQWMTRNSQVGGWNGGVWNMVFAGVTGAPAAHCGNKGGDPWTVTAQTPLVAEKPYITIDTSGKFSLNIPAAKTNSAGTDWTGSKTTVGFESVYVADNATDTADTINAALSKGLHLVLSPGMYSLQDSLKPNTAGQVILGLGMATLIAANGKPVIEVGDVAGVKIGGLLLQAGRKPTPTLLTWGTGACAGDASNPGGLYDIAARVGGPDTFAVQADVMVELNTPYTFIDNAWLWRADHTVSGGVYACANPCKHGLVVNADHVTTYGLAVEHVLQDLTVWNGNDGASYFYQSELPYDVTQAQFGDPGYVGYRVASNVTSHTATGTGVYTFFRDFNVTVSSGIVAPAALESSFTNPLGVFLNGKGTMNHILNDKGDSTGWQGSGQVAYVCP